MTAIEVWEAIFIIVITSIRLRKTTLKVSCNNRGLKSQYEAEEFTRKEKTSKYAPRKSSLGVDWCLEFVCN